MAWRSESEVEGSKRLVSGGGELGEGEGAEETNINIHFQTNDAIMIIDLYRFYIQLFL